MKYRFLYHYGILALLILGLWSCRENIDDLVVDQTRHFQPVQTTLSGRILSDNGLPVPNATVSTGTLKRSTDANGVFLFSDVIANRNGQGAMVRKPDHAPFIIQYTPKENGVHFSEARLSRMDIQHEFSAYDDNTIFSNHVAELKISPNSVVDAFGRDHHGSVHVNAKLFEGNEQTGFNNGTMAARNEEDKLINLLPMASIYFELSSEQGSPLSLKDPASLHIKNVPFRDLSLWHFSEITMEWQKLSDLSSMDQIDIDEPGYYTLAQPCHIKKVEVSVVNGNTHLGYTRVRLTISNRQFDVWTDHHGYMSLHVPSYINCQLEILDPCGEVVNRQEVSPSDERVYLDAKNQAETIRLHGNTIDCERNSLGNSYLSVSDKLWIPVQPDGTFDVSTISCGKNGFQVTAYNPYRNKRSLTYSFLPGNKVMHLPELQVCDEKNGEYVRYAVNGQEYIIDQPGSGFCSSQDSIYVHGDHPSFQNPYGTWDVSLSIDNTTPGDHIIYEAEIYTPGQYGVRAVCITSCDINIDMRSSNPKIGGYFNGSFKGTMEDSRTGEDILISGEFNVIRRY